MGRVMGLDVGTRRIGVALSDPLGTMALPHATVDGRSPERAAREIVDIMKAQDVTEVVVGWPVDMSGREGRAVQRVRQFVERVERVMGRAQVEAEVHRWDERLTTTAAQNLLIEADISRSRRKETVDQIAAAHILQGYMDARRIERERKEAGDDER